MKTSSLRGALLSHGPFSDPPVLAAHTGANVAVLGGGLSGLSTAWSLRRAGYRPVVFEASSRAGGEICSKKEGEWLHEGGPNALFEASAEVGAFIDELRLRPRALYAPEAAKKRYIVRQGLPVALPTSPLGFFANRLLSWPAKLRMLCEPFRARSKSSCEETVSQFVERRLGAEFLEYIVNPFVAGVYAGDPAHLSVRHAFPKLYALEQEYGSLMRGAFNRRNPTGAPRGRMVSFPNGLEEIPATLAARLGADLRLDCRVVGLHRTSRGFTVDFMNGCSVMRETFSSVVCTVPAHVLTRLHFDGLPWAAEFKAFGALASPSVVSVFTGYAREDVAHALDGFGLLVPQKEKRQILGSLFSSTLFPGRAPKGHVALTTFVGGMRQPEVAQLDDVSLLALVQSELSTLLGVRAKPKFVSLQRWPHAIPQYDLGFQHLKNACSSVEAASPGLFIGGSCRDGVSLANCIESGRLLAARVGQLFPAK